MEAYQAWLSDTVLESPEFHAACTHCSVSDSHYERQEFLGDALLGWVIAEYLYERFPDAPEGDLTRLRAHLVCRNMLSELARESGLGKCLQTDPRQNLSEQARSVLEGNALEAMIAAVYQVEGLPRVREFIMNLYGEHLRELPDAKELVNAKARLQECLAAQGHEPPDYSVVAETPTQSPRFEVCCDAMEGELRAHGFGDRIRDAEADAAQAVLNEILQRWPEWLE